MSAHTKVDKARMNKYNSTLAKLFLKDTIFSHKKALMDIYFLSGINLFSFLFS